MSGETIITVTGNLTEPEDPRVAVVAKAMSDALDDNGVTTCDWTAEARDILAKLDGLDR